MRDVKTHTPALLWSSLLYPLRASASRMRVCVCCDARCIFRHPHTHTQPVRRVQKHTAIASSSGNDTHIVAHPIYRCMGGGREWGKMWVLAKCEAEKCGPRLYTHTHTTHTHDRGVTLTRARDHTGKVLPRSSVWFSWKFNQSEMDCVRVIKCSALSRTRIPL